LVNPLTSYVNAAPPWSPEAERRLARVPDFLRLMVKKRTEAYVNELGEDQVTCQHLSDLAAARFGSTGRPQFLKDGAASLHALEKA
jgi:hypothetical protein